MLAKFRVIAYILKAFPPFPPYYYYYYYLIILVCIYKKNENFKFKDEDKNETNFK